MNRIKKVQKNLKTYGVDALVVQHTTDLLYLTGVSLSAGSLVVTKDDAVLFVDGRYEEKCRALGSISVDKAKKGDIEAFIKSKMCKSIGFNQDTTTYSSYEQLLKTGIVLKPLSKPIEQIRAIKEASELKALQKAADLCMKGFDFVCSRLKNGVTEAELAKELEIFWLKKGGDRLAFDSIIAFGKNSSMPHYRPQKCLLTAGDVVLIDIGVMLAGYASDMTRVVFFGKPDPKLIKIYDTVKKAKDAAFEACKPGALSSQLYQKAADVIDKAGYKGRFVHGLGHGIGLDVHEYPTLRAASDTPGIILKENMCVTLEPGIYIPGLGGVRLEDTVVLTKDGCKALTTTTLEKIVIDPK